MSNSSLCPLGIIKRNLQLSQGCDHLFILVSLQQPSQNRVNHRCQSRRSRACSSSSSSSGRCSGAPLSHLVGGLGGSRSGFGCFFGGRGRFGLGRGFSGCGGGGGGSFFFSGSRVKVEVPVFVFSVFSVFIFVFVFVGGVLANNLKPSVAFVDQLNERGGFASGTDKAVAKKFLGGRSLLGVLVQASSDEFFELLCEISFQFRGIVLGNQKQHSHRMKVSVRGLSLCHLDSGHTQRPDISLRVITSLFDNLRSHPERSTHKGVSLCHLICELSSNTEISQLDITVSSEKNVSSLDITMDLSLRM
mmetsp:Transcript_14927/g.23379  ORF Transcript_14927/g.23379 Transcript_14927/m.23379 type:complete len:304 (+) Transcript_14927:248-1159(+)